MSFKIDREFKSLLPPLADDEYKKLEQLLVTQGCLDAIKTWNGFIIDGHNRYEICTRRGVRFDTQELVFNNRDDVIDWIYDYQFGKRNMTDSQRAYLRGKQYERMKSKEAFKGNQYTSGGGENTHQQKTAQRLAEIHKVDERTIREDEKYAKAIDAIGQNVGEDTKRKILNRETIVPKKDVVKIGALPAERQKEIFDANKTAGKEGKKIALADDATRKCTKCGMTKPVSEYNNGSAHCRTCHSYLRKADSAMDLQVDGDKIFREITEINETQYTPNIVVTEFTGIINDFLGKINPYAYRKRDFESLNKADREIALTTLKKAEAWIRQIKIFMEV